MQYYTLSSEADSDLEYIYDYGEVKFGTEQTTNYLLMLASTFEQLAKHTEMGRSRDELRAGIRSFPKSSHTIFYRITGPNHIRIIRVLHGSKDIPRYFE